MINLKLGKIYKKNKDLDVNIFDNSIIVIEARSQTGKTQIARQIINQMTHRNIIQFDYNGEWKLNKRPNVFSRHNNWSNYLSHLFCIDNLGYNLSDYNKVEDWLSLGLAYAGARYLSIISKQKETHKNDIDFFIKICSDIGITKSNLFYHYCKKYNLNLPAPMNYESYKSMVAVLDYIKPIFDEKDRKYNINFLLKKYKHININLNLDSTNINYTKKIKARLIVSKVLEKLKPKLKELKPVLVFEEADILYPYLTENINFSSYVIIDEYIKKVGKRNGCLMVFITQNIKRLGIALQEDYDFHIGHVMKPIKSDRSIFYFSSRDNDIFNKNKQWFTSYDVSSEFGHYPIPHTSELL